jgi:kinesin family protein C2/C3
MSAKNVNLVNTYIASDNNTTNIQVLSALCDAIRQGQARDVFDAIKIPFKRGTPDQSIRAIGLLETCLDNTGMAGVAIVASEAWTERIAKVSKTTDNANLKHAIYTAVSRWASTYGYRPFVTLADKLRVSLPPSTPTRNESGSFVSSNAGALQRNAQDNAPSQEFIMRLHEDVSKFEIALQRPEKLTPELVQTMHRHKDHLTSFLARGSTLPDHVRFSLINEQRTLEELIELHAALYGGSPKTSPRQRNKPEREQRAHHDAAVPPQPQKAASPKVQQQQPNPHVQSGQEEEIPMDIDYNAISTAPQVVALQQAIRDIKEQISHEKEVNKNSVERIEALEMELGNLGSAPSAPMLQQATTTTAPARSIVLSRAKTLLASARALKVEIQSMKVRCREMTAQQFAVCDRLSEALTSIPQAAEKERKKDAKAVQRLQELYANEVKLRKQYYNTIQELKGNMRVFCRVCPVDGPSSVSFPKEDEIVFMDGSGAKKFEFDAVFGPDDDQDDVYQDTKPLVDSVLDGYNICVIAYGETGSGKTHTMTGPESDIGITRRAVLRLFEVLEERRETETSTVEVSAVEIFNETLRDAQEGGGNEFEIKMGTDVGVYVHGLQVRPVRSADDVRRLSSTNPKAHTVTQIIVRTTNHQTKLNIVGKLSLVDMAGSEKSGGPNKSLSGLQDVINALAGGAPQVPFKASKLTMLLQDHFAGQAKVLMFVCVNPTTSRASETLATLQFGAKARGVSLGKVQVQAAPPKKGR